MKQTDMEPFSDESLEKRLAESTAFTPSDDLKARILSRASVATTAPVTPSEEEATILPDPAAISAGKSRAGKRSFLTRMATLAASFLFVTIISFALIYTYALEADVIYIDVNPSLELSLNRRDTIIQVTYLNEDAKTLFGEIDLKGKDVDEGLELVMEALDDGGYMQKEDAEVNIAVYTKDEQKADKRLSELVSQVVECEKRHDREPTVHTMEIDRDEKKQAGEKGISPNKYQFIKEIVELSDEFDEEELTDMSVKELKRLHGSLRGQPGGPFPDDDGHDDDDRDNDDRDKDDRDDGRDEPQDDDERDDRDHEKDDDAHDPEDDEWEPEAGSDPNRRPGSGNDHSPGGHGPMRPQAEDDE